MSLDAMRDVELSPASPPHDADDGVTAGQTPVAESARPTGGHGPGKAVTALALVLLVAVVIGSAGAASRYRGVTRMQAHAEVVLLPSLMDKTSFALVDLGPTVPDNLKLGDCVAMDDRDAASVVTVDRVACDERHGEQVVARFDLPASIAAPRADEEAILLAAYRGCRDGVGEFVGAPLAETALGVNFFYPTVDQLAAGDRAVICLVWDGRGQELTASVAGAGEDPTFLNFLGMEAGDCFNLNEAYFAGQERVECSTAHDAEVFAVFDLPGTEWPGERAAQEAVNQRCAALFEDAVLTNPALGGLAYDFFFPVDLEWRAGETQACWVMDDAGPLPASVVFR